MIEFALLKAPNVSFFFSFKTAVGLQWNQTDNTVIFH